MKALDYNLGSRVATWPYHDAGGNLVALVGRWDKDGTKTFRPVSRHGTTWKIGDPAGSWPLYYLQKITNTKETVVVVVEGEKCADAASEIGLTATASAHGAQSPHKTDWTPLAGREVVLLPDADDAGDRYAAAVSKILLKLDPPARVKIVRLPELGEGEDIFDFVARRREDGKDNDAICREVYDLANLVAPEMAAAAPGAKSGESGAARQDGDSTSFVDELDNALTDMGNGKRFADDHGTIARYCHPWQKWLLWDGTRWCVDDAGRATTLAKETVRGLYRVAEEQLKMLADDKSPEAKSECKDIKKLLDFAVKSQHHSRIKALIDLAKSEPGIPILTNVLDVDPWVLNVANGTLDLKAGKLHPHKPAAYLTKICPVAFDPAATCPAWKQFLAEIFADSKPVMNYLQRLVGYWLTGMTTEHALPVLWGTGANGKSTLVTALFDLLGPDYSGKASRDLLTAVKGDKHPTSLAWLHGKRFVGAIETAEGARLDEALVKELTGGDAITARRMREDFWQFTPSHKIALVTNHKPTVRGTDHAIWRRLRLIPFNVCFPEDRQDKRLGEKLRAELPGILNWALAGCLTWQRSGLADPAEVVAATQEYRSDEDRLGAFLAERCQLHREFRAKKSDVYGAYKAWCDAAGERQASATSFGRALNERGIEHDAGKRWYLGIALLEE